MLKLPLRPSTRRSRRGRFWSRNPLSIFSIGSVIKSLNMQHFYFLRWYDYDTRTYETSDFRLRNKSPSHVFKIMKILPRLGISSYLDSFFLFLAALANPGLLSLKEDYSTPLTNLILLADGRNNRRRCQLELWLGRVFAPAVLTHR